MAKSLESARFNLRRMSALLGATAALACAAGNAQAQGVPGFNFYVGAGVGQSNADANADDFEVSEFDKKDLSWNAFVGVRALSFLGAEVKYIDFGKPNGGGAEFKYKGLAGYGLYYLPLPLPVLDVYVKAGVARLDADLKITGDSFSTDDTKFAYGAGMQLKFGSFAIRAEFEQFEIDDAKPSLLSLGFSKSFL
jgi:opacity protein-like surface antigen